MSLNLITVRAYSLEDKERYNFVLLVKRSTFTFYNKSVMTCHRVILFSTGTCLSFPLRILNCCFIGCKDKTSSWHLNGFPGGSYHGPTDYNIGDKSTVVMHTSYINHHAGTPNNTKQKRGVQ